MIELKNISKTYTVDNCTLAALNNINLTIKKGEIFGIIGKSGAGKSTLLRTINLLEIPNSGTIKINNKEINNLSANKLRDTRKNIGFVFQHFNLLSSRNVFDNIALPLELNNKTKKQINQRVDELLKLVNLEQFIYHPTQNLSGGQKQRVAIARALATDPDIILCDEATSALDTESKHNILNLLQTINEKLGKTIVLITHELDVVKSICDRTAILDQGKIEEVNNTTNIFISPKKEITRQLINNAIQVSKIDKSKTNILLKFTSQTCKQPVITNLIKQFGITINIIQANISKIKGNSYGYSLCELDGTKEQIQDALQYIKLTRINIEVINHD